MAVHIGSAPISWGVCEIPGWGPWLPYERVLDEAAAAGFKGTELGPWARGEYALARDRLPPYHHLLPGVPTSAGSNRRIRTTLRASPA